MKKGQRNERKRQQRTLKKRVVRREKLRRAHHEEQSASPMRHVRLARDYPIEGCWVQDGWRKDGLAIVVLARRRPDAALMFGSFVVDYYCLGLKDTAFSANIPPADFHRDVLEGIYRHNSPEEISPPLAHEVIYGAIDYAAQFGFRPHSDFKSSRIVLDPPGVHPLTGSVQFGRNGEPFYVAGPHDNEDRIVRQLTRSVGEGNFGILAFQGEPTDALMDYDDEEEYAEKDYDEPRRRSGLWLPGDPR